MVLRSSEILLTNVRGGVEVACSGVPLLHVLDGKLGGNAGVERPLGLLIVHLLNLPGVE